MDDDERDPFDDDKSEDEGDDTDGRLDENEGEAQPEWVKLSVAAKISGVGKSTLYDWVRALTLVGKTVQNSRGKPEILVRVEDCLNIREMRGEGRFKRKPQVDTSETADIIGQLGLLLEPHHRVVETLMTLNDKNQEEKRYWEERYRKSADAREDAVSKQHERTLEREDRDYERKLERKKEKKKELLFREGFEAIKTYGPIILSRFAKTDKLHEATITKKIGGLTDETVQAIIDSGMFDDQLLTAIIEIRKAYRKAAPADGKAKESESKTGKSKTERPPNGQQSGSSTTRPGKPN